MFPLYTVAKIGVYVDHAADGWGTIDDFYFGQK